MVAWRYLSATFTISLYVLSPAIAQERPSGCPITDQEFVSQLSTMKDWKTIYAVFKTNLPGCPDDGMFAEGYSDVIVRALAKRWNSRELKNLTDRNSAFRAFVLRHIDATTDPDELNQALKNARAKCPVGASRLCKEVARNATAAIKEMK
ncbi:MAG: hypothetical protein ACYC4K_10795 [Thiobacillus sp.]